MLRQSSRRLSNSLVHHIICGRATTSHQHQHAVMTKTITRHLSSTVDYRLEKTTSNALDVRRTPLGTMTVHQMDNTLTAATTWCHDGSSHGLESADLLVHRLGLELASGSQTARKFTSNVVTSHMQLISAYSNNQHNNEEQESERLDHAERLLRRLASWHKSGSTVIIDNGDLLPAKILTNLVQAWLKIDNEQRASELLLWWTTNSHFPTTDDDEQLVVPLFQDIWIKCLESENTVVKTNLTQKMQELTREYGWESLTEIMTRPVAASAATTAIQEEQLSSSTTTTSPQDDGRLLEINILMSKVIDFLQDASKTDFDKVCQYQNKLLRLPEFTLSQDICESLLDYYIRVEAPKEAAAWLKRLDQQQLSGSSSASSSSMFDRVLDVLKLLADSREEGGAQPWRATELFQRMEQLEEQGEGTITTEMYHLYCKIWVQSGEDLARKKVQEILEKQISAAKQGKIEKLPDKETYDLVFNFMLGSPQGAKNALALVVSQWKFVDEAVLQEKVGILMRKLAAFGLAQDAANLLRLAKKSNLSFDDETLTAYLLAHIASSDPVSTFTALQLVKLLEGQVPFECYSKTILALRSSRIHGAAQKERELMGTVLTEACNGNFSATTDQIRRFVEQLTAIMCRQRRPDEADEVFRFFQRKRRKDDSARLDLLTTQCFNNLMQGWLDTGKPKSLESTFVRLANYYKAGNSHLVPNKTSFSLYLKAVSKAENSADKAEKVLGEMLALHSKTGREDLKPDDGHFNSALIALKEEAPRDVVDRSMALLRQMKDLGILSEPFTFDTVMNSILASDVDNQFSKVMGVRKIMKEAGIEPSYFTHSVTLNACSRASAGELELALGTALESMDRLRESKTNAIVYTTFVKALRHLLKNGDRRKEKVVSQALQFCREDGVLNQRLERQFQSLLG